MKLIRHFQVIFDKIGNKIFLTEIKCLSVWKIKDFYIVYARKNVANRRLDKKQKNK